MGYLQADPNTHQLNGNLGTVESDEIVEVHSPNKRKRLDMQISEAELLPGSTTRIVVRCPASFTDILSALISWYHLLVGSPSEACRLSLIYFQAIGLNFQ